MRATPLLLALLAAASLAPPFAQARPLVLAVGGEPEGGFDPLLGWGRYGSPLFQSTLLRLDADLDVVGDLATEWALSEDRLTWRITLRDDARFSDGTPLTAEDVAFTFNRAREAGGLVDLQGMREARATGPLSVEIELEAPRITFVSQLTSLGIVPVALYGDGYARAPLGSGPFRLVEWREGESLIVEPNPHWHGGPIPFERVSFVFGAEEAALALGQTGGAQVVAVPPTRADAAPAGMRVVHVESVDNRGLAFPVLPEEGRTTEDGHLIGNDVTADRAVRLAVNQALDREALVALALAGHGRPATGPADGLPWDNPEGDVPGADPEGARATLEAAGWRDADGDGVREKDGRPAAFRIIYPAGDSTRQALALGAAEQLRAVGLDAEPSGQGWDEIEANMHRDVVVLGWGALDPSEVLYLYGSGTAGVDWFNTGFYANPAVDAHLAAAEGAESLEASLPHWQAAEWDGTTGFGARGDAAWAWMVNLDHSYWVSDCLDLGPLQVQPHGHGFPITHDIASWRWTCE